MEGLFQLLNYLQFQPHSKAVALTTRFVELSQASRFNHQSNWNVKSRAQATGEDFFLIRKIFELTFHLTERSVQHVGLVYCKNHSKLLENVHPDLDHDPVFFLLIPIIIVRP